MTSSTKDGVRVVGKANYDKQFFFPLTKPSGSLAPSSVRVQARQVSITSNNLSYCAVGTLLHWWDTYPVPSDLPSPYNDEQQYGIAPAWGYGQIVESTISELSEGTWLYGFWPTSSHLVDLKLQQSTQLSSNWIETSPHREQVMELYQRYFVVPESVITPWTSIVKPIWEAGYLLERFVFPPSKDGPEAIPPMSIGVPLSANDADLSNAIVVCLAAGTKTNRSFLELLVRRKTCLPALIIEVTGSSGQGVKGFVPDVEFPFQHKTIPYAAMKDPASFKPESSDTKITKVVVFDFGARDASLPVALKAIGQAHPDAKVVTVNIGGEAKVQPTEDSKEPEEIPNSFMLNSSGIRTALIEKLGEERYFKDYSATWDAVLKRQLENSDGAKVLGVTQKTLKGLRGKDGLEGVWDRLCQGKLPGDEGIVVDLAA